MKSLADYLTIRKIKDERYNRLRENVEIFFQQMVAKAEKDGYDMIQLLEKPDGMGGTVFGTAAITSHKIVTYILKRPKIDLRYINLQFEAPIATIYPNLTEVGFNHKSHKHRLANSQRMIIFVETLKGYIEAWNLSVYNTKHRILSYPAD